MDGVSDSLTSILGSQDKEQTLFSRLSMFTKQNMCTYLGELLTMKGFLDVC